jgi:hypothetical protein
VSEAIQFLEPAALISTILMHILKLNIVINVNIGKFPILSAVIHTHTCSYVQWTMKHLELYKQFLETPELISTILGQHITI